MQIPNDTLHYSHLAKYGAGALELDPGVVEPGCPRLYFHTYEKRTVPEPVSFQLEYGTALHAALYLVEEEGIPADQALRDSWPADLGPKRFAEALDDLESMVERGGPLTQVHTIAVEQHLVMPLYEDEDFGPIGFGGILDVLGVSGDMEEDPVDLVFADYKTNRAPPSLADLEKSRQFLGYGLLSRYHAPRLLPGRVVRIVGLMEATKWYTLPVVYSDERLDVFEQWLVSVARTILRDHKGAAKLNPGCSWCPIKDACPAWKQLPGMGESLLERMSVVGLEARVEAMLKAKDVMSKLDKGVKEVEAALLHHVVTVGPIEAGGFRWVQGQGEVTVSDARRVHRVMGDAFYEVVTVGVTKAREWLKRHPDQQTDMGKAMFKRPGPIKPKAEKL